MLVIIYPVTNDLSEGQPLLKFGINLSPALIIFPMHHFLEKRITRSIIAKGYTLSVEKILSEFKEKN